ncbi:GNAT family N-acetyltransferase [Erysipelatoclostridium sp. An173]|uniref:GNAT family N-acetyltransferase n=1 Tax=Erysipelatoclostridium sp. An173 TaxID=1965571 RepID=UPI000B3AE543|nr:GNAT family N-acetyltransferase [Erysipelatoclostridium sp. An173]OUP73630.1 GNAT family N-acetyltransferase [Erysipelatoclostridium sp. An173]
MKLRLANKQDLPQLKTMYKDIVENMNKNKITIWDDVYPSIFFESDILNKQLYVLEDDSVIVSAFCLCDDNIDSIQWKELAAKALYIQRLGVNVLYMQKGIGSKTLDEAKEIARKLNYNYLRLLVVDFNYPAINLYLKNGFVKKEGVHSEIIDEEIILYEHGYEIEL